MSREVAPFGGGGIGVYVTALARLLSRIADVTVITVDDHAERAGDPAPPARRPLPLHARARRRGRVAHSFGYHHAWAAAVLDAVVELYGDDGPDLIEVPDYHAEGFVLVQAKRVRAPDAGADAHRRPRPLLVGAVRAARRARPDVARGARAARDGALRAAPRRPPPVGRRRHPRHLRALLRARPARAAAADPPPACRTARPRRAPARDGPLAFAYVARLERRKGVLDLRARLPAPRRRRLAADADRRATPPPVRATRRCGRRSS